MSGGLKFPALVTLRQNLSFILTKVAIASLNGVGVRGLLSKDLLILGVLNVLEVSVLGVLRQSRAYTGVDVSVGRDEQGVEVQIAVPPLAVIGLLKN